MDSREETQWARNIQTSQDKHFNNRMFAHLAGSKPVVKLFKAEDPGHELKDQDLKRLIIEEEKENWTNIARINSNVDASDDDVLRKIFFGQTS